MRLVNALQKGGLKASQVGKNVERAAGSMSNKQVHDFMGFKSRKGKGGF